MTFHPVMSIDEVLDGALEPAAKEPMSQRVVAATRSHRSSAPSRICWSAAGRWVHLRLLQRRRTLQRVSPVTSGVSPTTLSERLEQLEAAGIVKRDLVSGRPPHAEYRLTAKGKRVASAVAGLLEQS